MRSVTIFFDVEDGDPIAELRDASGKKVMQLDNPGWEQAQQLWQMAKKKELLGMVVGGSREFQQGLKEEIWK